MSIQLILSNCSLSICSICLHVFFCLVVSNVVMFPQDMYKYRAFHVPTCSLFQSFFVPKEVCEELGFFCRKHRTLEIWQPCQTLEFVRFACQKSIFFFFAFFYYVFFSCDNTRYRCVWRCDICVSVVAFNFCSKH